MCHLRRLHTNPAYSRIHLFWFALFETKRETNMFWQCLMLYFISKTVPHWTYGREFVCNLLAPLFLFSQCIFGNFNRFLHESDSMFKWPWKLSKESDFGLNLISTWIFFAHALKILTYCVRRCLTCSLESTIGEDSLRLCFQYQKVKEKKGQKIRFYLCQCHWSADGCVSAQPVPRDNTVCPVVSKWSTWLPPRHYLSEFLHVIKS